VTTQFSATIAWRTSSYSQGNGACVELGWRTSSYTQGNGACVELARTLDRIRDSKHRTGPVLNADLTALIAAVKADRLHG
jgi:hypothetical protein